MRAYASDHDQYTLVFPPFSNREDRALLLSCLIFIDCRYLSNKVNN